MLIFGIYLIIGFLLIGGTALCIEIKTTKRGF